MPNKTVTFNNIHLYIVPLQSGISMPGTCFTSGPLTVKRIFEDNHNWDMFRLAESANLRDVEIKEVEKMLSCKDESRGFFVYRCESCGTFVTVHFGCNSRICTNCGKNHTDKWAKSLKKTMFNVPHRHAVLTIPDALWLIVRGNRFLLKVLMDAAIQAINDTISHKHRNGNLTAGAIVVLHPFHPVAEIPGPRTIPAPPSGAEGSGACFRLVRMRQHGDAQREPEYARSRQPRRLSLPRLKKCRFGAPLRKKLDPRKATETQLKFVAHDIWRVGWLEIIEGVAPHWPRKGA